MKLNRLVIIFVLLVAMACYDEKNIVAELQTQTDKGFYPVSANTFVDLTNGGSITTNRIYAPGTHLSFELQYWSLDAVQEVNVYASVGGLVKTKIFGKPYSEIAAYSKLKSADTVVVSYKTPLVFSETNVVLEIEILNENTLALKRTLTLKTRP